MGRAKSLLPLGEGTVIERCLECLVAGGLGDITVVLGPSGEAVARVLDTAVTVVWNRTPGSDMAASVRLGLASLSPITTGVLIALADYPLVSAATIRRLRDLHFRQARQILIPTCDGQRGHPVLFPRTVLAEISTLPTLRQIVRRRPERVRAVPVSDPGVLLDMDTPADYRRVRALWEEKIPCPCPPMRLSCKKP
jgi:molybdenum cofactor cytidylyltransferase